MSTHEQIFSNLYENSAWGNNNNPDYKGSSGDGSTLRYNLNTYIPFLRDFLKNNNINSVADLGCGDFLCGKEIYDDLKNINYHGYDTYKKIIDFHLKSNWDQRFTFTHSDFFDKKEEIEPADLCILKDVLQHWPVADIYKFLDYLVESKKFKYILITNCSYQSLDDVDISNNQFRDLSAKFLPLKKYNPVVLYRYNTKEVSLITIE